MQESLGIATGIVDGLVGVLGSAKMLEVDEGVFLHTLIERTEICGTEAEGVGSHEMMEVPIDELPVETVIVGNEHKTVWAVCFQPIAKLYHDCLELVEIEALLSGESTDGQPLRKASEQVGGMGNRNFA